VTERNQLQQQLARSDRLASLGLLAAGVGHEINNPLTYVIANLEELASGSPPGALRDRAKEALAGAQRVRDIVKDLRSFSRSGPDELALVDVHDAIEDAVKLADHEVSFRARLVRDYGTAIPPVLAHRRGLSQVIVNLLVNAAHAIRGGPVDSNEIRIETRHDGDTVRIAVVDTGKGIPPDQLQRIFDPFHSTKQTGVGLGLAICHEIVASFAGDIDVTSELGRGSRFRIALPAAKGVVQRPVRVPTELPGEVTADHGRVLVVDDEIEVRGAVSRALGKYFEVVAVRSATEAQTLLVSDPTFDLVFCDLMMPGTSGMALADWLAAELPEVAARIVFMTGGAFIPEAEDYLARTSHPILEKPFLTADLIQLARDTVARLGRRS
ncbi:MAG TPA: ATP-binding protein, partial [Kofleriaceae bacterium]|nr:ATP-binding protein [Kofleriaceae bacterium]